MKTRLGDISIIQTGLFSKTVPVGEIVYLQARHFDENGLLKSALHPDLEYEGSMEKHILKPGDVLFAAKGTKNFAALYDIKSKFSCVASTTFFVIRLTEWSILPEYLVWFINQPVSQKFLKANAYGTAIVSIAKTILEELEVWIPSMERQQVILNIANLHVKEKGLKAKIETLRELQFQQQILKALK